MDVVCLLATSLDKAFRAILSAKPWQICCLLTYVHPLKLAVTLTNLRDEHTIVWLDSSKIATYAAPDASTAWALTNTLLVREPGGQLGGIYPVAASIPESLQPSAKQQKLHLHALQWGFDTQRRLGTGRDPSLA